MDAEFSFGDVGSEGKIEVEENEGASVAYVLERDRKAARFVTRDSIARVLVREWDEGRKENRPRKRVGR